MCPRVQQRMQNSRKWEGQGHRRARVQGLGQGTAPQQGASLLNVKGITSPRQERGRETESS